MIAIDTNVLVRFLTQEAHGQTRRAQCCFVTTPQRRGPQGDGWSEHEWAAHPQDPSTHTGHFSSFHAMSQNIHSYRELMMKESSIRRFSSLPAALAH